MDEERSTKERSSVRKKKQPVRKAGRSVRRKKAEAGRYMIPQLLCLVCLVLVVFEGRMVSTLLTHRVSSDAPVMMEDASGNASSDTVESTEQQEGGAEGGASVLGLAGAGSGSGTAAVSETNAAESRNPEYIDSPCVVPEQSDKVDDSYFSNAVFIGDSRMEGFRNSSGITQGTFLTGIGLGISDMEKPIIQTQDGNISVYQGLSGRQYDRIYLMLGANDLGYYPWDQFPGVFESVIRQFHALQPHAIIYVCSVIYVDESKIAAGYEYDNNDNVRTINNYILGVCENEWYSYYLNLNEIFSDGWGSLISDASSDGIHLYAPYLEQMLGYLKSHYIPDAEFAAETAAHPDDIANAAPAEPETEGGNASVDEASGEDASADEASGENASGGEEAAPEAGVN